MHEHHAQVASRVAEKWPFRSKDSSWAMRRESYKRWLAEPGAFLLIASRGNANVGYLFGRPLSGWTAIDTGTRIGEIESLTVHRHHRGQGIGSQLMKRAHQEFAALGIDTIALSVFAENTAAIRFYERSGITPVTISYLGRIDMAGL
jgi:ribosomal protein S18 acetylase RimI-like enzyme